MTVALGAESPSPWPRLLLTWLALAVAMSANGIFRELVIRRFAGPTLSGVISAVLGIVLILLVTRALFPPLIGLSTLSLLGVSLVLVLLTVAFETALGILVDHKSAQELLAHYALWRGELWPIVLTVLALTPLMWGRWWSPR